MLRIYPATLVLVRLAHAYAAVVRARSAEVACQLERASISVPLNVAEGAGVLGGNRRQRNATALGSAREVLACCDVAEAIGCPAAPAELRRIADMTIRVLVARVRR
jgi:four helix bundle protein